MYFISQIIFYNKIKKTFFDMVCNRGFLLYSTGVFNIRLEFIKKNNKHVYFNNGMAKILYIYCAQ